MRANFDLMGSGAQRRLLTVDGIANEISIPAAIARNVGAGGRGFNLEEIRSWRMEALGKPAIGVALPILRAGVEVFNPPFDGHITLMLNTTAARQIARVLLAAADAIDDARAGAGSSE